MASRSFAGSLVALLIAGMVAGPATAMGTRIEPGTYDRMAKRYGVDPLLLRSIAMVESNGYPWTVNLNHEPFVLKSREEMMALVSKAWRSPWVLTVGYPVLDGSTSTHRYLYSSYSDAAYKLTTLKGYRSHSIRKADVRLMDIGVMQINLYYHGRNVPSVDTLANPEYNIAYAARFLHDLAVQHGRVHAVGYYHASSPEKRLRYFRKVMAWYRAFAVGATVSQRSMSWYPASLSSAGYMTLGG